MSIGLEVSVFLAYAFGMLMVYILGRFLLFPLKWILWGIASSLCGGVVIMIINLLGDVYGILIPLNMITAAIVGVLGLPGLVMIAVFFC
jgi:inhibitor of the pro-sigma K processing machinery